MPHLDMGGPNTMVGKDTPGEGQGEIIHPWVTEERLEVMAAVVTIAGGDQDWIYPPSVCSSSHSHLEGEGRNLKKGTKAVEEEEGEYWWTEKDQGKTSGTERGMGEEWESFTPLTMKSLAELDLVSSS